MRSIIFASVLSILLASCFEPREACLDIAATNFDASADKDCCCIYPKITLTVNQVYDNLLYKSDSLYLTDQGQIFRLKNVAFYLSDVELTQLGTSFTVSDTLTLVTREGVDTSAQLFTNDFLLVRRSPVTYTVGTFRQDGNFETVKFRLGLSDAAQKVIPAKTPSNHPLGLQTDGLWQGYDEGYVWLQAVVVRNNMDTTPADTLRFTKADLGQVELSFNGNYVHPTGYDFPLILTVDYKKLFDGVNWSQGDISSWKSQIVSNIGASFSVSQ
jgi:hypothetical protein